MSAWASGRFARNACPACCRRDVQSAVAPARAVDRVGVGLGMAFLGEVLLANALDGLPLVVLGVVAMTLPARRAPAA